MTYHCLCLGDRRGRFGRSYRCSSFGGHCTYIHHLFQKRLLSCGIWSAYGSLTACTSFTERLYVGVLHLLLYCTCISSFLSPFLFFSYSPLFRVCLCVYCLNVRVCVASVWCGVVGSSLSLSLWNVAGMVVEWLDSRGEGEPACNCGDAGGLEEAIAGQGGSYLVHPNLSCNSLPSCFIDCSKQCIIIFSCFFITI